MVQETEAAPVELDVVSCGTCDTLFISSERRQTCPACGGEGVGPFFEFVATPEGPRLKNGAVAVARAEAPPAGPAAAAEAPAAEGEAVEADPRGDAAVCDPLDVFTPLAVEFLRRGDITQAELSQRLQELGADPEAADT